MRMAKRIWFVCCWMLFMFLLVGCGKTENKVMIPQELAQKMAAFETMGVMKYGELEATVAIERKADQCVLTFQKPEELQGLRATMTKGDLKVSYGDIDLNFTNRGLLDEFAGQLLISALNRAAEKTGLQAELCEEGFLLSGQGTDGSVYQLRMDAKTGCFLSLNYPQKNLQVEFYEFRFTEQ